MDADPEPSQSTEFSKIYEPAICPFCFNSEFYNVNNISDIMLCMV